MDADNPSQDPAVITAALACARAALGDVGLVAWTPLSPPGGPLVASMVLLTDAGGRTVIVAHPGAGPASDPEARPLATHDDPPLVLIDAP